jgi:uncharacterized repeat protein (TIGR03847 family)
MAEIYEYRDVSHFTAGAVGEPGQRTFFLQAGDPFGYHSVKLEKQQVNALANFLSTVLVDLPTPTSPPAAPVPLLEPAQAVFVVGQIAVGVDEADSRVVLVVEELVESDDDPDAEAAEGSVLRVHLTVDQAAAFIETSKVLMEAGRPPCRLCGQPLDPSGHLCPRLN